MGTFTNPAGSPNWAGLCVSIQAVAIPRECCRECWSASTERRGLLAILRCRADPGPGRCAILEHSAHFAARVAKFSENLLGVGALDRCMSVNSHGRSCQVQR